MQQIKTLTVVDKGGTERMYTGFPGQEMETEVKTLKTQVLPLATAADNGKVLKVVGGTAAWAEDTGGSGAAGGTVTKLEPKTLCSSVVKLTDAKAVGLPLEAVASAAADKLFVGGKNWFPTVDADGNTLLNVDGELVVDSTTKSSKYYRVIDLGMLYPAEEYRFCAEVATTATDAEGNPLQTNCTVRFYNGTTLVATGELKVNRGSLQGVIPYPYPTGSEHQPFNKIYLYAGSGNTGSEGVDAVFNNVFLCPTSISDAYEYVAADNGVHTLPVSGMTVDRVPLYLFADDGEEVEVTYYNKVTVSGETEDTGDETTASVLPDYYFAGDYLPDKADTVNALMQETAVHGDAFVFVTDMHTERGSKNGGRTPDLLRYLRDHTKVRRLFVGGDSAISLPQHTAVSESLSAAFDGDIHYVMGNHEYDTYPAAVPRMTEADLYYTYGINKPDQIGNPARHYYYVDNPQQKMRYVVVNNWMHNMDTEAYHDGMQADDLETQAAWLTDTAFCVEAGWGIVVFCHQFFNGPDDTAPSGTATAFMAAIDGYDGDGEILAVFHGHIHRDLINRTGSGVPVIGVTADKTDTSVESVVLSERTLGTVTEQAFDVVVIDRTARKLHCVRIGAPAVDGSGAEGNALTEIRVVDFRETEA